MKSHKIYNPFCIKRKSANIYIFFYSTALDCLWHLYSSVLRWLRCLYSTVLECLRLLFKYCRVPRLLPSTALEFFRLLCSTVLEWLSLLHSCLHSRWSPVSLSQLKCHSHMSERQKIAATLVVSSSIKALGLNLILFMFTADPDWASYTLGIFVCLNCSGTHRNLSSISRIKSIRLDFWDDELVQVWTLRHVKCLFHLTVHCELSLFMSKVMSTYTKDYCTVRITLKTKACGWAEYCCVLCNCMTQRKVHESPWKPSCQGHLREICPGLLLSATARWLWVSTSSFCGQWKHWGNLQAL